MNPSTKIISSNLRDFFQRSGLPRNSKGDEPPLRAELFSEEQMEQHGKTLAGGHKVSPLQAPDQLLSRLAENEVVLSRCSHLLTETVKANRRITPAGEWLLDNFYRIEEQIRTAKKHLPKGYSRELPRLLHGPSAGLPRVYDIALETISHGDGRIDLSSFSRFVGSYQTVAALKLGELWAIPIMLRLALIENLRRVAVRIATDTIDRAQAESWADQMMRIAEKDPKSLILVIADMARSNPPMVSSFVAELARRLQGQGPALALPLTWIEQHLAESGLTIEQLVQSETQQQAADQVSISNSIGSLGSLGAVDWRDFVETHSVIERVLREDPVGVYRQMDFATRDHYRHVVEKLAKRTQLSEGDVARKAVQLAHDAVLAKNSDVRAGHVGFYLIFKGLPTLERAAEVEHSLFDALHRLGSKFPLVLYLGTIIFIALALTEVLYLKARTNGLPDWLLAFTVVLLLLCTSELSVALVNWLCALLVVAKPLARLDFSKGIPPFCRSLVVVPTMLVNPGNIEALVEALEVRFLANRDENLYFALVTDLADAQTETTAEDEPLVRLASQRIDELNEKYKSLGHDTFFLFHRPRRFNPQERIWMGYERKRGKLGDLNAFLRGRGKDQFSVITGDTAALSQVKYVITLDTDTQLPRDSARQFIGTMAHPLNSPQYDSRKRRVCEGYGILQPRVSISLPNTNRSLYARIYGSEPGIDPYTRTVSDVYQDVFGEGSFIGKGIYDVDAFEQSANCFPENRILSHDLLEGCYARSGLLSDVQLFEEYPARYSDDVNRRYRWIRGDWQLLAWLMPRVPGPGSKREDNPLSALSRWKILDNLRRSLIQAALTLLLLLAWTVLSPVGFWSLAVLAVILIPPIIASLVEIFQKPDDVGFQNHFSSFMVVVRRRVVLATFALACLPYEAFFSLAAVMQTCLRLSVTRKGLLQWTTSSDQGRRSRHDLVGFCLTMCSAPLVAMAAFSYLVFHRPAHIAVACPILVLWFVSPAIAWWVSRPIIRRRARLTSDQSTFLQKMARKTWAFFENFVQAKDNWLPPDNFQEHPVAVVAHRTSPTNIGLALLANLSAYDFGYITAAQLIERTASTFASLEKLERHRGHFYNWYDTQSLKPLPPAYISTVDSGNLAAALLTLRPGLLALSGDNVLPMRLFDGFGDTLEIIVEAGAGTVPAPLDQFLKDLRSAVASRPTTLLAMQSCLTRLAQSAREAAASIDANSGSDIQWWADALSRQCSAALEELTFLAPWTATPGLAENLEDFPILDRVPTLQALAGFELQLLPLMAVRFDADPTPARKQWFDQMRRLITEGSRRARERMASIERLALQASAFANMEYEFLFDETRCLLSIGYHVEQRRLDASFYDLLASEARLCNFVAIAQGQLPQESWFALGRLLTAVGGESVLLSWSGTMFEYLMPLLVMPSYEGTLLDQTYKAVVERQIEYGKQRGVPWGISESGYNKVDVQLNYQYRAFGVPGLGLKRGLAEDLVIAPYASALALMVLPEEACLNLERLAAQGFLGKFGFFEAIDYTASRLASGQSHVIVRSFMAHHQGMSLLSLAYLLLDRPMQKRFECDPAFQATTLLLQERVPKTATFHSETAEISGLRTNFGGAETPFRVFHSPNSVIPEVQLLSNGRYHVMMTNAGGGYSCWKDLAVTRFREDTTCDNWGTFCYIRDLTAELFWSAAHQPTLKRTESYEAIFSESRVEFRRRDHDLVTHTEILVSSEDDIELRRVRITNRSSTRKTIDLTSYAEVVLASQAADALHPAFSNLFVQTEILDQQQAILCNRRPRSKDEQTPWMFHVVAAQGTSNAEISYETDRLRFIGRGGTVAEPEAMRDAGKLSGSCGSVLDPIVAIRWRTTLNPEESATVNFVTGIGETREICLGLVDKYHDRGFADRVFDLSSTHSQVVLRQLNATESDAQLYGRLASSVIYANSLLRADASVLIKNRRGQSGLWGYAISGDLPIVLLQIQDPANIDLVRQLVQAHAYWRLKGLAVDLVIWNEDRVGYRQQLQEQILALIAAGHEESLIDRPGGIFVRPAEHISVEDRILIQSVARAIITDSRGSLEEQIGRRSRRELRIPRLAPTRERHSAPPVTDLPARDLLFFNGLGGFTPDGREYVITINPGQVTPAPWANVLANPHFGTVISESGRSYTWSGNAHEYRLTPWANDPVGDTSGEAFYIRDEETGYYWSPSPLPARGLTPYVSRHGFGYSVFEHTEDGISSELWVFVALDAPLKFSVLKLNNHSGRPRKLSVTGYVEWVLGDLKPKSAMHVVTEVDPVSGALFARNSYSSEFAERVAFFDVDDASRTVTGDRTEFFGRNGTPVRPSALDRVRLSGKVGAALDPCAAIRVPVDLADGQEREIIFRLGAGRDAADARQLVHRFRGSFVQRDALEVVFHHWKHMLGTVNVDTPDQSLNMLTNGWLLYQTIACRLWARSGYYQSGGAFGFRDQLQDVMALIHAEPRLLREQLVLCAGRQFKEGDVQHWWHPPSGRGVRTRCSDDYLWLPLATCRYVLTTGDTGILDQSVHFLEGRPVNADEDSYYDLPNRSDEEASLYDHCVRAIERGLRLGLHGLPLMGTGDWNDGMNLVGNGGKGESVWLAFFLYDVLMRFSQVARLRGDTVFAKRCQSEAERLRKNVEKTGWDGGWYRRAYFDDGTPLGSASNDECQIDSIAQSWSVLSGAGDIDRARMAMDALEQRLVRKNDALIQLLDPPFDKSDLNPGYIIGYVPGVRENGGQYTHGAIWAVMAFAALGDSRRAWELFSLINPVNHARTPAAMDIYKVEPYVVAADVYAVSPHTGRGGWTWYSGSAGWMYRLIIESLLGLRLDVDKLRFAPCFRADWQSFKVHYRFRETVYHITVSQIVAGGGPTCVTVDGIEQSDDSISLVDDHQEHSVEVRIQSATSKVTAVIS